MWGSRVQLQCSFVGLFAQRFSLKLCYTQMSQSIVYPFGYFSQATSIVGYSTHLSSNLYIYITGIFPKGSIIPSFRRSKNIKEILAAPKRTNLAKGNDRGCFKYNRQCNFLLETEFFMCTNTSRKFPIRQNVNCKSKNVIYLITCNKCNLQYAGPTSNEFKVRFLNHKSAIITNKNTC